MREQLSIGNKAPGGNQLDARDQVQRLLRQLPDAAGAHALLQFALAHKGET
jgi:hypothetical protein